MTRMVLKIALAAALLALGAYFFVTDDARAISCLGVLVCTAVLFIPDRKRNAKGS